MEKINLKYFKYMLKLIFSVLILLSCNVQSTSASDLVINFEKLKISYYDAPNTPYIGIYITFSNPSINGRPLQSKFTFDLDARRDFRTTHAIGLRKTFSKFLDKSVSHKEQPGNFFITANNARELRRLYNFLGDNDRLLLKAACGKAQDKAFVKSAVDYVNNELLSDKQKQLKSIFSSKRNLYDINIIARNCSRSLPGSKVTFVKKTSATDEKVEPNFNLSTICSFSNNNGQLTVNDFRKIQYGLKQRGLYAGEVDGVLGKGSCSGFKDFMKYEAKSKIVSADVLKRLETKPSPATLAQYPTNTSKVSAKTKVCNENRAIVRSNQTVLKDLGFYTSLVDGLSGPNYRSAVTSGEQLLGTRADDNAGCLNPPERQILSSIYDASRKGSQCKVLLSVSEVKTTFEQLKASKLTKKISLGYANVGGLMWMIDTISDLEKRLSFTDFYKEMKTSKRDCRLDRDEFEALVSKVSGDLNFATTNVCNQSNLKVCDSSMVCVGATKNIGSKKVWDEDSTTGRLWFAEAKRRNLDCGIASTIVSSKAPTCEDDPTLCSVVQLCGKAALTVNGDRAWNTDAKAADYVALAKSTGVTCGVKPKPVVVAKAATCEDDPTKCSVIELCQQATGTNALGEKFWRMDAALQTYVDTAKSTGVTCGVVSKVIETAKLETCENTPSKCSLAELCQRAISFETGKLGWTTAVNGAPYVQFAKNSGMTCGVQEDLVAAVPEQKQVEPPAPKKVLKYPNRKALVIGNANYVDQTPLKNPINDAKAVAAKLEQIGFEVTYEENLKVREFGRTLGNFEREVASSDISLIYYAGHGIEVDSVNYLIPVDAELSNPSDVKFETVMLDDAVGASLNTGKLSMVLVDACRDNPFAKSMVGGSRSVGRGLSIVDAQPGKIDQIISFAAESGEVAEDGTGNNSPYATALLELLDEPNLEVGKLFRKLGDNVERMTNGKQIPVTRNRLSGEDIYLVVE